MTKTTQGQQVKTVKISGQDYVTVAERSRVAHEIGNDLDIGYCIVDERWFEMAGRWFVTVTIRVNDQPFQGTAEVKFNATKGADKDAPAECAETSAVGRALGFAGIGALDSIASADEVMRSTEATAENASTTRQEGQQPTQSTQTTSNTTAKQQKGPVHPSQIMQWLYKRGITTIPARQQLIEAAGVKFRSDRDYSESEASQIVQYAMKREKEQKSA